ncbi:MAG: hypothetical protein EAY75_03670 [Bacteroidetes bacterium]|nr:MAG: hypothetical protein EAY75_03670 [Bacteroidota bacterium]
MCVFILGLKVGNKPSLPHLGDTTQFHNAGTPPFASVSGLPCCPLLPGFSATKPFYPGRSELF